MLGFEGVDIGLFEERSHLWPSREFENVEPVGVRASEGHRPTWGSRSPTSSCRLAPGLPSLRDQPPRPGADAGRRATRSCGRSTMPRPAAAATSRFCPAFSLRRRAETSPWPEPRTSWPGGSNRLSGAASPWGSKPMSARSSPTRSPRGELLARCPGLTLTLDYTHFTRAGLPDDAIEPLLAHASHIHVRGARTGRLQVAFKDNVIDYKTDLPAAGRARTTAAGWASNTSGSTGSTATSATISPRRSSSAISSARWQVELTLPVGERSDHFSEVPDHENACVLPA